MQNNIRLFRELAHWSQERLAEVLQEKLGRPFNQSQVSNLEKSENPPYPILKAVLDALNPALQDQRYAPIGVEELMSERALEIKPLGVARRVLCFVGGKGGVGKSTLSYNVAAGFALKKQRVLFVDLDHQRNSTGSFVDLQKTTMPFTVWDLFAKYSPHDPELPVKLSEIAIAPEYAPIREFLALVPSHAQLSRTDKHFNYEDQFAPYILQKALQAEPDFDVIIVDCPGGSGILVQNALVAATEVIVPTSSGEYEENTVIQLKEMLQSTRRLNPYFTIKVVFNKFDGRTKLARQAITRLQAYYPLFETKIPHYEVIKAAVRERIPVYALAPSERGAKFVKAFVEEVVEGAVKTPELRRLVKDATAEE